MKTLITVVVFLGLLGGCGAPSYKESPGETTIEQGQGFTVKRDKTGDTDHEIDRMVVSTAEIRLQSLNPDSVHTEVIALAAKYDGYVLKSGDGSSSIRIPSIGFDGALNEIYQLGDVIAREISGEDVTERFSDLQTRLNNAEKTRLRYLEILQVAETIDQILRVERELERINQQIELYKGKIERLSHLVAYSTITVSTTPEIKPGPVGFVFEQLFKGLKWLFVRN